MTKLSEFLTEVLPFVRECPDMVAETAIRKAIIDFCEQTHWLQYEAEPITVYGGQAAYELETPLDTQPVIVVSATLAGNAHPLKPMTQDGLVRLFGDWRSEEGDPVYYTQITRNDLRLVPSPTTDVVDGLRLILALRPTDTAQEIDDTIYDRYDTLIGLGARARLKSTVGQPYSDADGAKADARDFRRGIADALNERRRDFTSAPITVQMRRFI